jgi:hypothetical protein
MDRPESPSTQLPLLEPEFECHLKRERLRLAAERTGTPETPLQAFELEEEGH